jgi:glutaredoxin
MKIEILRTEGCPTYKEARRILEEVMGEEGIKEEIKEILIENEDMARELKFIGSPTIRINGADIEKAARGRQDYGLRCRVYITGEGVYGWPSKEMIREALREAKE